MPTSDPAPTHLIYIVVALTKLAGVLHNDLEMGQTLPDLQHLVQLLLVLHNAHIGLAVVKDVLTGLGRVGWVDTNTESPGGGGAGGRGRDGLMIGINGLVASLANLNCYNSRGLQASPHTSHVSLLQECHVSTYAHGRGDGGGLGVS